MNFDDNALYRRPEVLELRDLDEEDETEIEANKHGKLISNLMVVLDVWLMELVLRWPQWI